LNLENKIAVCGISDFKKVDGFTIDFRPSYVLTKVAQASVGLSLAKSQGTTTS